MHEDAQTALETAARRYDHSADELEAAANHLRTAARWFRERHVPVAAPTPSPRTATCAPRKSPSTRTPSSTLLSRSPNRREARYPQRSGDWRAIESSPRGRAQERVRHGMSVARPTPRGWSQRRSRLSRGRLLGAADRPGNWTRQWTVRPRHHAELRWTLFNPPNLYRRPRGQTHPPVSTRSTLPRRC